MRWCPVTRVLTAGVAAVVVIVTIALALLLPHEPSARYGWALAGLVVSEVWIVTVVLAGSWIRRGDALNFLPATLAALPVLVISVIGLAVDLGPILGTLLYVVGWAAAVVMLLVSIAWNTREARRAVAVPKEPDFTITHGSA